MPSITFRGKEYKTKDETEVKRMRLLRWSARLQRLVKALNKDDVDLLVTLDEMEKTWIDFNEMCMLDKIEIPFDDLRPEEVGEVVNSFFTSLMDASQSQPEGALLTSSGS